MVKFLLLLAYCNNTRFQQKDLNSAISIKIGQNYKSTTSLSLLPWNYRASIPSFCNSLIGSMIQKKSRNSIKRRIIFFHIRPSYTELLPQQQSVYIDCILLYKPAGLALCASLLEAAQRTGDFEATHKISSGPLVSNIWTFSGSLHGSRNAKNPKFLYSDSVEALMKMLCF